MKRHIALSRMAWLLAACATIAFTTAKSQTITHVEFDLPSLDYDVIYLGDFVDISSNKLAKDIPNFSGTIRVNGNGQIVLEASAQIMLTGDASPSVLATATTKPFTVNGSRTITANDLAGGISDIDIADSYENKAVRKRIEDYATTFPTAPTGTYTLELKAWNVVSNTKGSTLLGTVRKLITVKNASPEEVQVNLIDPQPGETIRTKLPQFSWSSPNPKATIYVYEKSPYQQSLQEAASGVPYLQLQVDGTQTIRYPESSNNPLLIANAQNRWRQLNDNKEYVWFVEATVTTNRQTVVRRSEVRFFRIRQDDQQSQAISDMMNSFGGPSTGTLSTLQNMGWVPSGIMTLDGKPVTLDDLKALVAKLAAQNIQINVRVE